MAAMAAAAPSLAAGPGDADYSCQSQWCVVLLWRCAAAGGWQRRDARAARRYGCGWTAPCDAPACARECVQDSGCVATRPTSSLARGSWRRQSKAKSVQTLLELAS
eukprot:COSAG05_NODE_119_length_17779_cov_273.146049_2_plen_106_part_00